MFSLSSRTFSLAARLPTPNRLGVVRGVPQEVKHCQLLGGDKKLSTPRCLISKPSVHSRKVNFFSTKALVPSKPLGLPGAVLLAGGTLALGSHLSARELCREFLPSEIRQLSWEQLLDEIEELRHHNYPIGRLLFDPIGPLLFSFLAALAYKLERPSQRGRVLWVPRLGSTKAAVCVTGATLAAVFALDHLVKSTDDACTERLGCVLHADNSNEKYEVEWFQKTGSMDMSPRQREVFLREKWYFFGNDVIFSSLVGTGFFLHVCFRNLVAMTNPAAAVCLNGMGIFGLFYSADNFCGSCEKERNVKYVPLQESLAAMVWSVAYFATGRLAVVFAASAITGFLDLVKDKPATLPFALSMRGTTSKEQFVEA